MRADFALLIRISMNFDLLIMKKRRLIFQRGPYYFIRPNAVSENTKQAENPTHSEDV